MHFPFSTDKYGVFNSTIKCLFFCILDGYNVKQVCILTEREVPMGTTCSLECDWPAAGAGGEPVSGQNAASLRCLLVNLRSYCELNQPAPPYSEGGRWNLAGIEHLSGIFGLFLSISAAVQDLCVSPQRELTQAIEADRSLLQGNLVYRCL